MSRINENKSDKCKNALCKKSEDGMMRGYQKRVIYLKNTGSSIFEEAYFIMKTDRKSDLEKAYTGEALIEEANRIIEENSKLRSDKKRKIPSIKSTVIFTVGFLCAALISILFLSIQ